MRKTLFEAILDQPEMRKHRSAGSAYVTLELDDYAAYKKANVEQEEDGRQYYVFDELKREQ